MRRAFQVVGMIAVLAAAGYVIAGRWSVTVAAPPLAEKDAEKVLRVQAQAICDAVVKGEWEKMADLTHQGEMESMGGRKKFLADVANLPKELQASKLTLVDSQCGPPSDIIANKGTMYAVVNAPLKYRTETGKTYLGTTSLIGVSTDGGRSWKFVGGSGTKEADRNELKKVLPDLPDSLVLPKGHLPILLDD